ncbi:MAG: Ca2+-binding RTX toxin-like protein [Planctomycetota bacterium]|jgi:Ca2+-binding RTX toxin-like protein
MGVLRSIRRAAVRRTKWLEKLTSRGASKNLNRVASRHEYRMETLERRLLLSADPLGAAEQIALLDGLTDLSTWGESVETHGEFHQFLPFLELAYDPDLGIDQRYLGAQLQIGEAFESLRASAQLYFGGLAAGAGGDTTDLVQHWNNNLAVDGWAFVDKSEGAEFKFGFMATDLNRDLDDIDLNLGDDADALNLRFAKPDPLSAPVLPTLDLDVALSMNFDVAWSGADSSSFTVDLNSLDGSADVDESGLSFGLNVGILGMDVTDGTFFIDADISLDEISTVLVAGMDADPTGAIPTDGSHLLLTLDGVQHVVRLADVGAANVDIDGLALDLNAALADAGVDTAVEATVNGSRLEITSLTGGPESIALDQAAPFATEIGFTSGDTATGTSTTPDVVLTAAVAAPADGKLTSDVSFDLVLDSAAPLLVSVAMADTMDNTDAAGLVADINAALTELGLDTQVQAGVASGFLTFTTLGHTSSAVASLTINELVPFAAELGFSAGVVEAGTVLTLADLQSGEVDSLLTESVDPASSFSGSMTATPVSSVSVDVDGSPVVVNTPIVGLSLTDTVISLGTGQELFQLSVGGAAITMVSDLATFAAASPNVLIQPLLDIDYWLAELDSSSVMEGELPFVDNIEVTDLADLEGAFQEFVMDGLDIDGDSMPGDLDLFDNDGFLDLRTVQQLIGLSAVAPTTIGASFDTLTDVLDIGVSVAYEGVDLNTPLSAASVPFDLELDLDSIGAITPDNDTMTDVINNVVLTPSVAIDLTYGVDLSSVAPPSLVAPLETLIEQTGQLTAKGGLMDAHFQIKLDGVPELVYVTLSGAETSTNAGLIDLVADIDAAIVSALSTDHSGVSITAQIVEQSFDGLDVDGPRLVLEAAGGVLFTVIVDDPLDPAFTQLGLGGQEISLIAANAPSLEVTTVGSSMGDDAELSTLHSITLEAGSPASATGTIPAGGSHIELILDGQVHVIHLVDLGTPNTTLGDLKDDLQASLNDEGLGSLLTVEVDGSMLKLVGSVVGPGSIAIGEASGFSAELGFSAGDSVFGDAAQLGFASSENAVGDVAALGFDLGDSATGNAGTPNATLTAGSAAPIDGQLTGDVNIYLSVDGGQLVRVQLSESATAENANVDELVESLNQALVEAQVDDLVIAGQVAGFLTLTTLEGTAGDPSGLEISTDIVLGGVAPAPVNGQLASDVDLFLRVDGGDLVQVQLTVAATAGNSNVSDLVADLTSALVTAGIDGEVEAGEDGGFLTLTTKDGTVGDPSGLRISPNVMLTAGVAAPINGQLASDLTFQLKVDTGAPTLVRVAAGDTTSNGDVDDLVISITSAIAEAGLADSVEVSNSNGHLRFTSMDGVDGDPSSLTISALEPFATELGFLTTDAEDGNTSFDLMLGGDLLNVSFAASRTYDNFSGVSSLAADVKDAIDQAIDDAGLDAVLKDSIQVSVNSDGGMPTPILKLEFVSTLPMTVSNSGDSNPLGLTNTVAVDFPVAGDYSGLRFVATEATGVITEALNFQLQLDNAAPVMVSVPVGDYSDAAGLVFAIQQVVDGLSGLAGKIVVGSQSSGDEATVVANRLTFTATPGADVRMIHLLTDPAGITTGEIGFNNGSLAFADEIVGAFLYPDSLSTPNTVSATVQMSFADAQLDGQFGFFATDIANAAGEGIVTVGVALQDAADGDANNRIDFEDLYNVRDSILTASTPLVGANPYQLASQAEFSVTHNGVTRVVQVEAEVTQNNTKIQNLVYDINQALRTAGFDGEVVATREITATDEFIVLVAGYGETLSVSATNPSAQTGLGFMDGDAAELTVIGIPVQSGQLIGNSGGTDIEKLVAADGSPLQFVLYLPGVVSDTLQELSIAVKLADIFDIDSAQVELLNVNGTVTTSGSELLYRELTASDLIGLVQNSVEFLGDLRADQVGDPSTSDDDGLLAIDLPFIKLTANELNSYDDFLADGLGDVVLAGPNTLQLFTQTLQDSLGSGASVSFGIAGDKLTFDIDYVSADQRSRAFQVDIAELGKLVTLDKAIPDNLDEDAGLVDATGQTKFQILSEASVELDLALNYMAANDSPEQLLDRTGSDGNLVDLLVFLDTGTITVDHALYGSASVSAEDGYVRIGSGPDPIPADSAHFEVDAANGPQALDYDDQAFNSDGLLSGISVDALGSAEMSFFFEESDVVSYTDEILSFSIPNLEHYLNGNPLSVIMGGGPAELVELIDGAVTSGNPLVDLLQNPDVIIGGFDTMIGKFQELIQAAFIDLELPLVGEEISGAAQTVVDVLSRGRAEFRELVGFKYDENGDVDVDLDFTEVISEAILAIFGPGTIDLLQDVGGATDLEENIIADGQITAEDVHFTFDPGDEDWGGVAGTGEPGNATYDDDLVRWDFKLGQEFEVSVPFDLGLRVGDFGLEDLLPNFGFTVDTGPEGVVLKFEWELWVGFGLSAEDFAFFFNVDAHDGFNDDDKETEELKLSVNASTPGLSANLALGLVQGDFKDGTKERVSVTASDPFADLGDEGIIYLGDVVDDFVNDSGAFNMDGDFSVMRHYQDGTSDASPVTFSYNGGTSTTSFFEFLRDINGTPIAPDSLLGNELFLLPDLSDLLKPVLVLTSLDPDVVGMEVIGGGEYGWAFDDTNDDGEWQSTEESGAQYEDQRSKGLGFGTLDMVAPEDRVWSDEVLIADPDGLFRILGTRIAPSGGKLHDDAEFTLTLKNDSNVDTEIEVAVRQAIYDDLESEEELKDALNNSLFKAFSKSSEFDNARSVVADLDSGGHLVLVSTQAFSLEYDTLDHTEVEVALKIDATDAEGDDNGRLTIAEAQTGIKEVFSPELSADAKIRFNVDGNTDHITNFLESIPLGFDGLGLPSLNFDLIVDASAKVTYEDGFKKEYGIDKVQFDNVQLELGELLTSVITPIVNGIADVLGPVTDVLGDGLGAAQGFLNDDIELIERMGLGSYSILDFSGNKATINNFLDTIQDLIALPGEMQQYLADNPEPVFNFGCWELVMDKKHPLYFPTTKTPVPCELLEVANNIGDMPSLLQFDLESEFNVEPGGFKLDILSFDSVLNMLVGNEFNIFSFNLPTVDISVGFDVGFSFGGGGEVLNFNLSANATATMTLGLGFDSKGLEHIVDALRIGATPKWIDLLDSFFIKNNPNGPELGVGLHISGGGGVDFTTPSFCIDLWLDEVCFPSFTIFAATGSAYFDLEGGFDIQDPNNDGKLRLDEIMSVTDGFSSVSSVFNLFDIYGNAAGGFDFSVTVLGLTLGSSDLPFDTNFDVGFNLGDLLFGSSNSNDSNLVLAEMVQPGEPGEAVLLAGASTLRLNSGVFSNNRLVGDTDDTNGGVNFVVSEDASNFYVSFNGSASQSYAKGGINKIIAYGSQYGDTFDFSGMTLSASDPTGAGLVVEVFGLGGNDHLIGGSATDIFHGGLGNDTLDGGGGVDILLGEKGDDLLKGGAGKDFLDGGKGNDTLRGEGGDDTYLFEGSYGHDTIEESASNGEADRIQLEETLAEVGGKELYSTSGVLSNALVELYLDAGASHITSITDLANSITHVGNQVEEIFTGGGDDEFIISALLPDATTPTWLNGQDGNDDYRIVYVDSDMDTVIDIKGDLKINDTGFAYNTDRLLVDGSAGDDILGVAFDKVSYRQASMPTVENVIDLSGSGDGSGIEVIAIDMKAGHDVVNVESTAATSSLAILGGIGNDIFNFGVDISDYTGLTFTNLNLMNGGPLTGPMIVDGEAGGDTINVHDNTDTAANTDGVLTADSLTGLGMDEGIEFTDVETFNLELGTGADLFNIQAVDSTVTASVFGNDGSDVFNVSSDSPMTNANGDLAGDLNSILGLLNIDGQGGSNNVINVSDADDTADHLVSAAAGFLTKSTIKGLGIGDEIEYLNFAEIRLVLGSGDDLLNVLGTEALTWVDASDGDDTIQVSDLAPMLSGDGVDLLGTLEDIDGTLRIEAGMGKNRLNVSDFDSVTADTVLVTSALIQGLASVDIHYAAEGDFSRGINVWAGTMVDNINITSVQVTPGERTFTTVHGGFGNDVITASIAAGLNGDLVIRGREGEDNIDASASSAALFLIGDEGIDEIHGGSAGDTIFGDGGRIYLLVPTALGAEDTVIGGAAEDSHTDGLVHDSNFQSVDLWQSKGGGVEDIIFGGLGDDTIVGGGGDDTIAGEQDNDIVFGDNGRGVFFNNLSILLETTDSSIGAADDISGSGGNDTLVGGAGNDTLDGAAGADVLIGDRGRLDFIINDAGDANSIIQVRSKDLEPTDRSGGQGQFDNVDHFTVGESNATGQGDSLLGSIGEDTLIGGSGADYLDGNQDADVLIGDGGNIVYEGGMIVRVESIDTGDGGVDTLLGSTGADVAIGGFAGDSIQGNEDDDVLLGDSGRVLFVDGVITEISSIAPNDGGNDTLRGATGDDTVFGGTGRDMIYGDADNDLLLGDHGLLDLTVPIEVGFTSIFTAATDGGDNDTIFGAAGDDTLMGQQGDDELYGEANDDDLIGGHNVAGGADELDLDPAPFSSNDTLDGGSGFDVLAGDNARVERRSDAVDARFQVLNGSVIWTDDLGADVTGVGQTNPTGAVARDIELFDHTDTTPIERYGNDVMAGGSEDDLLFGQLGDDILQGDSSVSLDVLGDGYSASGENDGDDYIEGGGHADLIYGNDGQDDIIGGSSSLYGLDTFSSRPDGSDRIFGDSGLALARNEAGKDQHGNNADTILGDDGNIYRLVGINGVHSGEFLSFTYDNFGGEQVIARAFDELDYTYGEGVSSNGAADTIRGENGDDTILGMAGDDVLFGDAQDDDVYGGSGSDWISGGTGEDGVLGDDGRFITSRNSNAEDLYGVEATTEFFIWTRPDHRLQGDMWVDGELNKGVDLLAFEMGGDDTVYGGLGGDSLHGGAGDDLISGSEALLGFFNDPSTTPDHDYDTVANKFVDYNHSALRDKIGGHALNFDATDSEGLKIEDGDDALFGDGGNDWLMGGTGFDHLYGGAGNDFLNMDDNLETDGGHNNLPDAGEFHIADTGFGGGGIDTLAGASCDDRLVDSVGVHNLYVVPFWNIDAPVVTHGPLPPEISNFIALLGAQDGADQTFIDPNDPESVYRRGEPNGELNIVIPGDPTFPDELAPIFSDLPGNIPNQDCDGHPTAGDSPHAEGDNDRDNDRDSDRESKPGKGTEELNVAWTADDGYDVHLIQRFEPTLETDFRTLEAAGVTAGRLRESLLLPEAANAGFETLAEQTVNALVFGDSAGASLGILDAPSTRIEFVEVDLQVMPMEAEVEWQEVSTGEDFAAQAATSPEVSVDWSESVTVGLSVDNGPVKIDWRGLDRLGKN